MDIKEYKALSPEIQKAVFNELLIKSIEVVRKTNKTSISHFQRKLKIGFSLACEIKNELEKLGIIEDVNKRITFENLKH